jgi:hypothetical protein
MGKSSTRLRTYIGWLLASAFVIVAGCFAVNCLVDPLWYLGGNVLTKINYPFNERLSKVIRLMPRLKNYDCVIFGTSRATLLPEDQVPGYHCYNLAFSDGQVSEYLPYARYLRQRGFDPKLLIVEVRRGDLIGPLAPPEVPEFIPTGELPPEVPEFFPTGEAPPSILANYLSLDVLNFSIRTLRRDAPHHRYYDQAFHAHLEVRSKKHYYNPADTIAPMPPPLDLHTERGALYDELRRQFPRARAIGYVPPESAWRMAAFSLTDAFEPYLAAIAAISANYDRFLDFSAPSPLTTSKSPKDTYDGVHYSRTATQRILAELLGGRGGIALDWRGEDPAATAAALRSRLEQFTATLTRADAGANAAKGSRKSDRRPTSD